MTFKELLHFIEKEDERLAGCYDYPEKNKRVLARTVKLSEEVGELSSEVLAECDLQRKDKLSGDRKGKIAEELSDVLIVALLLAKTLDIDVEKSLEAKIKKIEKRHGI